MNKTIIKLAVTASAVIGTLVLTSVFAFNAVRHVIIEDNEALVHSVAQKILPALLANDTQQVETLLKGLESYPGVQSAELVSAQGAPIASFTRSGQQIDPSISSFELASADEDPNHLHVMAPLTFDSLIVANLHIAVNLWPTYLRIMVWLGVLLIVPSVIYVLIKQLRLKLRYEVVGRRGGPGNGGDSYDVKKALNAAMSDADISVEFQPIQRMSDSGLFGMEVVVCWRHPSGQTLYISPADFAALALKNGLCLPFDEWLLCNACAQAASWQHQYGPLVLSIHLSESQFNDPLFADKVREICKQAQYPHQLLELEVSGVLVANQLHNASSVIEKFADQGLSVTLNNFGLLQNSPDQLSLYRVNKVKLDRKLVHRIGQDEQVFEFVKILVERAVTNEVQVMANGVERADQREVLLRLGCILGQGNHFHPPLSKDVFEALLASRQLDLSLNRTSTSKVQLSGQNSQGLSAV